MATPSLLLMRIIAILVLLLLTPAANSPQAIVGRTLDTTSQQPVEGVEIAVLDADGALSGLAVTDPEGRFRVQLARAGVFHVETFAIGYDTLQTEQLTVGDDQEVEIELQLGPRPLALEPMTVLARRNVRPAELRDFYYRLDRHRISGRGTVLGRDVLEEHPGLTASRVLRRYSGFVDESRAMGLSRIVLKRRHVGINGAAWCEPAFYLDGLPIDGGEIRSIPVSDLEGLEVYRSVTQVPSRYLRSGAATSCGVILAWTRRS